MTHKEKPSNTSKSMSNEELRIRNALLWCEDEIKSNPHHPTNVYMERERSKLLKELHNLQVNTHINT